MMQISKISIDNTNIFGAIQSCQRLSIIFAKIFLLEKASDYRILFIVSILVQNNLRSSKQNFENIET